ncbi:MAG: hypothetical protein WCQ90_02335 [Deltaproteobacteria bacterium]
MSVVKKPSAAAMLRDNSLEQKLKSFLSPEILLIDEIGFDKLEQHDTRNASLFHKVIDGAIARVQQLSQRT